MLPTGVRIDNQKDTIIYEFLYGGQEWAQWQLARWQTFAAYTFAPVILVTPLEGLSVIIGAVLAANFLKGRT